MEIVKTYEVFVEEFDADGNKGAGDALVDCWDPIYNKEDAIAYADNVTVAQVAEAFESDPEEEGISRMDVIVYVVSQIDGEPDEDEEEIYRRSIYL